MKKRMKDVIGKYDLISSKVNKINIYSENYTLNIEVDFQLLSSKYTIFRILFKNVQEYSFFWNINYYFYNVENYKFIYDDGIYYLSLDPVNEENEISEEDQDYIKAIEIDIFSSIDNNKFEKIIL